MEDPRGPAASPAGPVGACQLCGTAVPGMTLGWMSESTVRGVTWTCPTCARTHLRAIESKLDQEYW